MATELDFTDDFTGGLNNYQIDLGGAWSGTDGDRALGCFDCDTSGGAFDQQGTNLTLNEADRPILNFSYRIINGDLYNNANAVLTFSVSCPSDPNISYAILNNEVTVPDTGWVRVAWDLFANPAWTGLGSVEMQQIDFNNYTGGGPILRIDDIFFSTGAQPARFYFGQGPGLGVLAEKFTLPFTDVSPQGMSLSGTLGTVVIGSRVGAGSATGTPVAYAQYPYSGWTDTADGFPTGTATSVLKWV